MLDEPTYKKLIQMRMRGLADAWLAQQKEPDVAQLGFDERLGLLIDAESMQRENKKMQRSLRVAKLRLSTACIEDIDYDPTRKLDKKLIRQLATCKWITLHQNRDHRDDRRREELPRLRSRPAGVPPRGATVRRARARPRRWQLPSLARHARQDRRAHPRRLGPHPSARVSVATSTRSWTTATARARPSSPASFRRRPGTTSWEIPPYPQQRPPREARGTVTPQAGEQQHRRVNRTTQRRKGDHDERYRQVTPTSSQAQKMVDYAQLKIAHRIRDLVSLHKLVVPPAVVSACNPKFVHL